MSAAVYRDFDQAALDAAYDNTAHVGLARREEYVATWARRSDALRAELRHDADMPYGRGRRQVLDWIPCGAAGAPTLAYIHGGYWQRNEKDTSFQVAGGLVPHGINVANLEYTLAPEATMDEICAEIRLAVSWLLDNLGRLGGDARRLYVAGHSAGGHLTAIAMGDPRVAGGLAVSGLFDLEPIRLSYLNAAIGMDAETALRNSPIEQLPDRAGRLLVSVGGAELAELQRQSQEYAQAWSEAGLDGAFLEAPGHDHFSIIEELVDPDGGLARALVELACG